jgi:hypothetical protein
MSILGPESRSADELFQSRISDLYSSPENSRYSHQTVGLELNLISLLMSVRGTAILGSVERGAGGDGHSRSANF